MNHIITKLKYITNPIINRLINKNNLTLGRWKTNDNQSIKASLANMDCCGDNHCGTPGNYTQAINHYISNKEK